MRNCFKCCFKSGRASLEVDTPYIDSNESVDNLSMISVTYGLESFTKNAMLVFCQVTSELGNRNRDLAMKEVTIIKETFQKYRFEVETHVDLTSNEVEKKCDEFFAQDFSEYGAVAVVVLAPNGESGTLSARDKVFHESIILKYLTSEVPVTLRGKPKIYITEANRTKTLSDISISLPILDCYEDVLGLHIPSVIEDTARSPLRIFCNRMNNSEDRGNLIGIVIGSVEMIEEVYPDLEEKLELVCTFRKRFTLPVLVVLE